MKLLSILIALVIESFVKTLADMRRFDWFTNYVAWMRGKLQDSSLRNSVVMLLIIMGLVLFVVWLIDSMLGNVLGLFSFVFGVAVLVFCIGPRDLEADVKQVLEAFEREDVEAANFYAAQLLDRKVSDAPMQLAQTVREGILLQANSRMLGVLFWFVILGPVGAVMFRLSCILKNETYTDADSFASSCRDLYDIMLWLPARICVLSYAIAGNFVDTMSYWYGLSDLWRRESEEFIVISGVGALRYERRIEHPEQEDEPDLAGISHALALVKRAVIVWIVILALLTLTGWLF